jgi:hypothetical protein
LVNRSADCVVPRNSCGPVFTLLNYHGNVSII